MLGSVFVVQACEQQSQIKVRAVGKEEYLTTGVQVKRPGRMLMTRDQVVATCFRFDS